MEEIPLTGGNVAVGVVRVGDTVRKPAGPWTPAVHALLVHLEAVGFRGAPRSFGLDDRGRHVLEYVEGVCEHPYFGVRPASDLVGVGRLVRAFHDAVASFAPPADAAWNVRVEPPERTLVIHHDLAPWNYVRDGPRDAVIDWDGAGPGYALWDLAYTAIGFIPMVPGVDLPELMGRLTCLARGYGLDEADRLELAGLLHVRAVGNVESLRRGFAEGEQPWAGMWVDGHGETWQTIADFVAVHRAELREALLRP